MDIADQNELRDGEERVRALRVSQGHQHALVRTPAVAVLILILTGYIILGSLFAAKTPAWQAPDEPAHYNYIAYLAENGTFPVLHFGDYPHGYLEEIKTAKFPPDMPVTPIRYESHQPPLYYVLAAPIYDLTQGNLFALRLFSVLLGAGIVVLTYGVGRRVAPRDSRIALGAAAIVAFLPQHLATVSQVGNDVLAELLLAGVLFLLSSKPASAGQPVFPGRTVLMLGVLLGLILITKTTAYIAVPLALGVVVWGWFKGKASLRRAVLESLALVLPAALIALPWYARDVFVYGWPDFLGLMRHEQVVVGQTRTAEFIAANGWPAYWARAAEWTYKSFVGVFGWMGVWLDSRVYYLLGVWLAVPVIAGITGVAQRTRGQQENERMGRPAEVASPVATILATSALLTLLAYIYYNITFLQHQGRYLFTALIPIAIYLALGWRRALEPRTSRLLVGILIACAVGLAGWGVSTGHGLPKWPLALTVAVAAGVLLVGLLPQRLRRWAYALPFAILPLTAAYALFGAIMPALRLP